MTTGDTVDYAELELGDGTFRFETDVEVEKQMRTQFLLENTLDRVLGAINDVIDNPEQVKRTGIYEDVGGGTMTHTLSFREADDGTNKWGGTTHGDATGETARKKADVLFRYLKMNTYDTSSPARLQFGLYNPNGEYENNIPCAIQDIDVTVSAEQESTIQGQITLVEVAADTILAAENNNRLDE